MSELLDPRSVPAYTIAEAARYLRMPRSTLASWFTGRIRVGEDGEKVRQSHIITPSLRKPVVRLSFENLVEAHVLLSLRGRHDVSMPQAKSALAHIAKRWGSQRPLLDEQLWVDSERRVLVEKYGQLIRADESDQIVFRELFELRLSRVDRENGLIRRLYPFLDIDKANDTKITIDPFVGFGRPVITGTGIRIEIIAERHEAGETDTELAEDYGVALDVIRQAIHVQRPSKAA